ncbi:MAG: hypothetical protein PF541_15605 [Prolixibacteraceae bacterium]|jgi:hypothetical protein|nr:hypothetical protein [Prolixibacteraceae bacterium]
MDTHEKKDINFSNAYTENKIPPEDLAVNVSYTIARLIETEKNLSVFLKRLCDEIVSCTFPFIISIEIIYNAKEYKSKGFKKSSIKYSGEIETTDHVEGIVWFYFDEVLTPSEKTANYSAIKEGFTLWKSIITGAISSFRLKEFSQIDQNKKNELGVLIPNVADDNNIKELVYQSTERLKELKGINTTSDILKRTKNLYDALPKICKILPLSFQYPQHTVVQIKYDKHSYQSDNFVLTKWKITQYFQSVSNKRGVIEVFYTQFFPEADDGPFLNEERNMLINLAALISGRAIKDQFGILHKMNTERIKELDAINQTSKIIEEGNSIDETLNKICQILPPSWQYPKYTSCRITFEGNEYKTPNFVETEWIQKGQIITIDNKKGEIAIAYLKQFPIEFEGPFLLEEQNLLRNICKMANGYLNSYKGLQIINKKGIDVNPQFKYEAFRKSLINNKKPLQLYFNQQSLEKYIYFDMMKYKVKHILFVSTLYDAFMLESEDSFFAKFMGTIYQYSLFSLPRITGVSSEEEAIELLKSTSFDLVILMVGLDRKAPILTSEKLKKQNDTVPIYLLLNKKSDLKYFETLIPTITSVDNLFVWNGDSSILFAIVKSIEDRINVENDTRIGLVRVILLIEDSPLYYSKYLQMLYSIVFDQVQRILPEVEKNELDRISRIRSRPKVLLARNYEEAASILNQYKDFILSIISDAEFEKNGKIDKNAGVKFIKYAKSKIHNLHTVLQSSEEKHRHSAEKINAMFLNKNSKTLIADLTSFLKNRLGFGSFVFRNAKDEKIAVAKSLREFESLLKSIPDESFYLHALDNQFSIWLMSRGEIQLAKTLNPIPISSIENVHEARKFFLEAINHYREEKKRGNIIYYDETATIDEKNIITFCKGSLGGKGRGLAFINMLIYNYDFSALNNRINISTPITVIIGTNEFQKFIKGNELINKITDPEISYAELRTYFINGKLSASLIKKLKVYIDQVERPIAVRSSSTSEDSLAHPFSGVFDTYLIPNSRTNKRKILELLSNAIKMVYVSVYSDNARIYFEAINHRIEDEKMAIVLQELVGSQHKNYYYPHISGIAHSYNYYPVAKMKPEEGFAVTAVGLGSYVVNGMKSYRFSPVYPKVSVYSIKDLLKSTQCEFYALNCKNLNLNLLEHGEGASMELLDIEEAENHGTLKHCVSVYNANNDTIEPGLTAYGPRIVNFANILQYDYIPLAETLKTILKTIEEAFGSPVEIEFAVDLEPGKNNLPTFYLLQIKPLLTSLETQNIDFNNLDVAQMLLYTSKSLGNGELTKITDVIYIAPDQFNKLETLEMVAEIEKLNNKMIKEKRKYILIGPGRWGTRDQFLGIPVNWAQISNAKVIVETSLENFPLDSSLGSHFFHNVTSMNIGYFSVLHNSSTEFIRWDKLEKQKQIKSTKHFKHIRFESPLNVIMDGRKKSSVILF